MTYDIDDILFFQASGFDGDATAFKNKCAANVNYANAFTGSRCTNIPA